MKILHLFGNWKWTGPADPAISLAAAQAEHARVELVVGPCPFDDLEHRVVSEARSRGLDPCVEPSLGKHLNALRLAGARRALGHLIDRIEPDIVHAHLDADHAAASLMARRRRRGRVVRTLYEGMAAATGLRRRLLLRFGTTGAVVVSPLAREEVARAWPGGAERVRLVEGGVDLERFRSTEADRARGRADLELREGQVALGIVARVQKHRRWELLLEAFQRAALECEELVLVVLGRGTAFDDLVARPARRAGIADRVRLPGYREGRAYVRALAALDGALYLVPGTDGSCRAVREEMAMGLPVIVSKTPPLDDLVRHEQDGLQVDLEVGSLAAAMVRLARDEAGRRRMGRVACAKANDRFSWARAARQTMAFYESLPAPRAGGRR